MPAILPRRAARSCQTGRQAGESALKAISIYAFTGATRGPLSFCGKRKAWDLEADGDRPANRLVVAPPHFRIDRRGHGVAAGGVKRTRIRGVLTAIFPPYQMTLRARRSIFPGCPQKCPQSHLAARESHWTPQDGKTLLSMGFLGIFGDFET